MDEENLIFRLEIKTAQGAKIIAIDPYKVDRLMAVYLQGEPLHEVIETSKSLVEQLAIPAMDKLLNAIQKSFGLEPLAPNGVGLTEKAQIRVLREYLRWKNELKKNIGSASISSSPSAPASSPSPMSNSMPCGPCGSEQVSNARPLSVPASAPR